MKSTKRVCDYCGEPSKWGYYRFDGGHVCDDCGDFVHHAVGSHGKIKLVVVSGSDDESPQERHGHPTLSRKVDRPLKDLLVSITPVDHDVVFIYPSIQHDCVTIDTAKPRNFFAIRDVFKKRFLVLIHNIIGVITGKVSSTNV